jgi:response regulator RpfG family c-di-GMP phosphodiesterase
VRHHHEYLDGSGYPDALMAPEISDLVRTISDIFAALITSRPYSPHYPATMLTKSFAVGTEGWRPHLEHARLWIVAAQIDL